MTSIPTLLLGTSNIGPAGGTPGYTHDTPEGVKALVDAWATLGGTRLDTAAVYGSTNEWGPGGSERFLHSVGATDGRFVIDTKSLGFGPGEHAQGKVRASLESSLANLGVTKVNIFYLHSPDRSTPFRSVLEELDTLYKEGKFTKLGLSNYTADEVIEICELSDIYGLVRPEVYQGNYSALCRRGEPELFPVLRKFGMAFYAYSPLAMGMLTGGPQKESLEAARTLPPGSRFHPDSRKAQIFQAEWFKPEIFDAVKHLNSLSTATGITPVELSLRWIAHHSALDVAHGDGIILGASSVAQLEQTVKAVSSGPLDVNTVAGFDKMWEICASAAPAYCN